MEVVLLIDQKGTKGTGKVFFFEKKKKKIKL